MYVAGWKLAVTYLAPLIASVQSPRPVHPPPVYPFEHDAIAGRRVEGDGVTALIDRAAARRGSVVHAIVPVPTGPVLPPVTVPIAPPLMETDTL